MDDTNKEGLSIEGATCLTFGYDQEILITKKIDEKFAISNMTKMAKNIANGKNLNDFEKALKRCLPDDVLKKGELQIFNAINNLKEQIKKSDKTYESIVSKQPSNKKMPLDELLTKYLSYSSLKYSRSVAGGQSTVVFSKEYALLNLDARNAIIGLREITTDSICKDAAKMTQIKHLKTISDSNIVEYAKKFMVKHKFITNENLIKRAWKYIKSLSASANKQKSSPTDDISDKNNSIQILKKFSANDLSEVNIKQIDKCKNICIQNMALSGESINKLSESEADIFKQLCFMYTGDLCKFMNGYLRNKLVPVYNWEEQLIKGYRKIEKGLEFYSTTGFGDKIILPYKVYIQIKEASHLLIEHLKKHSLKPGSECWRLMDVAGLNSMLSGKILEDDDKKIKDKLKKASAKSKLYARYDSQLKGKCISVKSFLSTSLNSNGVLYVDGVDKKSIVMKIIIKGNPKGVCMDNYTPEKYKGMSEFLFNINSKLKIESTSEYTGKTNIALLKDKCLQLNCSC